jgi:hypothetical protein
MSIALRRNGSRRRKIGDSTARWDHSQATGIAAGPDNGLLTFSVTPVDRTSKLLSFHEPQQHAGCWVPQVPPLHLGILTLISAHVVLGLSFGSRARSSKAADGDSSGRCRSLRDRASIEVEMTPTVVALQTSRHGEPQQRNRHPKTQVPTPNLVHPPPLSTFTRRSPLISSSRSLCQQGAHPGPPARCFFFQVSSKAGQLQRG